MLFSNFQPLLFWEERTWEVKVAGVTLSYGGKENWNFSLHEQKGHNVVIAP